MANIKFKSDIDDFGKMLSRLERMPQSALDTAIQAGADVVADQIRSNLSALSEEPYRHLNEGEVFYGLPEEQKQDLLDSFGLAPIETDKNGFRHTKAGFDGYGSKPTKKYPKGLPNQLLARAVESGSSVRVKKPFVRPAVNATKKEAVEKMKTVMDEEIKKICEK